MWLKYCKEYCKNTVKKIVIFLHNFLYTELDSDLLDYSNVKCGFVNSGLMNKSVCLYLTSVFYLNLYFHVIFCSMF